MSQQVYRMVGKSAGQTITFPVIDPATYYSTNLNFGDITFYSPNLASNPYKYTGNANVYVSQIKVTIPNLRGSRIAPPSAGYTTNNQLLTKTDINSFTSYFFNLNALDEWTPLNAFVTPSQGNEYWFVLSQLSLQIDFRNLQTVYDGILVFAQVEIDVYSATAPYQ